VRFDKNAYVRIDKNVSIAGAAAAAVLIIALGGYFAGFSGQPSTQDSAPYADKAAPSPQALSRASGNSLAVSSVELSASEFAKFKVEPVAEREFTVQRQAVGTIDFNQEMSVQVFSPFQGKIIELFKRAGDAIKKDEALFTIDSPDLLQAESTLLSAAGIFQTTTRALRRANGLYAIQGMAQKDLDSAISDQQTAEGTLKAARNAVRIFGKTDADVDRILAERRIDSVLRVYSPITGQVTARNAAPGLYVQPGSTPAPYTVADVSTKWLLANVNEYDVPLLRLGQRIDVTVQAYPNRSFTGQIVNIGAAVDPNSHKVLVRSQVRDPGQELRPGMFARYVIRTGKSVRSPAIPYAGVVREGDGTMTVWVATDGKRLVMREVKTGLQQDGYTQILEGVTVGEQIATEGALYLSNALTTVSR
jgi:cobalt-zinc-cadmium efflux system membrane fusion protein